MLVRLHLKENMELSIFNLAFPFSTRSGGSITIAGPVWEIVHIFNRD